MVPRIGFEVIAYGFCVEIVGIRGIKKMVEVSVDKLGPEFEIYTGSRGITVGNEGSRGSLNHPNTLH